MNTTPTPAPAVATTAVSPVKMKCPSTLLLGAPGAGKTHALTTFLEAGVELFVLITDPGGEEALLDTVVKKGLSVDKLHWSYIPTAAPAWSGLVSMAKKINTMGYDDLTKIKTGIDKQEYQQFIKLLGVMADFTCARTGLSYGAVDTWGDDRAFAIDSFSGVSTMAMDMMIGGKPAAHQGEWGVSMNALEKLVLKCCSDIHCYFALIAHIERETDEVEGGVKNMVSTLGKKLAPKIPKNFSDVVLAERNGDKFTWSTNKAGYDLKARTLPLKSGLDPHFGQMVDGYKKRKALTT